MAVIALYNIKGGVGKTTVAVNIAYLASVTHGSTLLIDLDPQGSASFYFRVKPDDSLNVKKLLKKSPDILESIKATNYPDLDILPADFSYRKMDVVLDEKKHSKNRLSYLLAHLKEVYQIIILDCPPNITLESENVFRAADFLMVPIIPTTLSMETYTLLLQRLGKVGYEHQHIIPFFNLVDRRRKLQKETIESAREREPGVCSAEIPYSSDIEKMGIYREPVVAKSRSIRSSKAFVDLWNETSDRILTELTHLSTPTSL